MRRVLLSICCIFYFFTLFSQNTIRGRVINTEDNSPVVFASVIFNDNPKTGVISDINGHFIIQSDVKIEKLTCSHIGFETREIIITNSDEILIFLPPLADSLAEVTLYVENPAKAIIKQVIANKNKNNPKQLSSFTYNSYSKITFDIDNKENFTEDSVFKEESYLLLMENTGSRKFLYPDLDEEVISATRVSGLKNPNFGSLATDLQPFSFYEPTVTFFDINYVNPVSTTAIDSYQYYLEETKYQEKDTVHIISYRPLPNKNFDGLTGLLYINRKNFAIQSVTATPHDKPKMEITIRQLYSQIENEIWFPEQLHYEIVANVISGGKNQDSIKIIVKGQTFIKDVTINAPLQRKDFSVNNIFIAKNASVVDSIYWISQRQNTLSQKELNTYRIVDSIGNKHNLDSKLAVFEKIVDGKIPAGVLDIDIAKIVDYNHFEGFRLGIGSKTNMHFSKKIGLGGYFAYGFKDDAWKYGANLKYYFDPETDFYAQMSYQNDLSEAGNHGLRTDNQSLFNYRKYMASHFDSSEQIDIKLSSSNLRYIAYQAGFNYSKNRALFPYVFFNENQWTSSYSNSSFYVSLRFGYREKSVRFFNKTLYNPSKYPVFYLNYSRGIKDLWEGNFNYNKIELALEQSFYTNKIGKTSYRLETGYIDTFLPYNLLFTGEGGYDKNVFFFVKNHFQTMSPYEFLSDSYINAFFSHNFESLLLKINRFQPNIIIHTNLSWGNLNDTGKHYPLSFNTKEKLFVESGLIMENLLRFNYMNITDIGFGAGGFYRYGHYTYDNWKDNLAFKLAVSFTVK